MIQVGSDLHRSVTIDKSRTVRLAALEARLYGTPNLLADAEAVCEDLMASRIVSGRVSLSVTADIIHLRPAVLGDRLEFEARIIAIRGNHVIFDVTVANNGAVIATVRHQRAEISVMAANQLLGGVSSER